MEDKIAKHRQMMGFRHSYLTHNIFDYCLRLFFFGLVYMQKRSGSKLYAELLFKLLAGLYCGIDQ